MAGRLSLTTSNGGTGFAVGQRVADELATAAPCLHTLALDGDFLVPDLCHPVLTYLEVDGFNALRSWDDGAELPSVVALDLVLDASHHPSPVTFDGNQRIEAAKFPRLITLDLSGNAASRRVKEVARVLDTSSVATQLHHVKLPAVLDGVAIRAALHRMPNLQTLRVPDWYGEPVALLHPTATFVIPPRRPGSLVAMSNHRRHFASRSVANRFTSACSSYATCWRTATADSTTGPRRHGRRSGACFARRRIQPRSRGALGPRDHAMRRRLSRRELAALPAPAAIERSAHRCADRALDSRPRPHARRAP